MLRLYQAYQDRNQAVLALADRLSRDPFLGESIHQVLTHVTAIRAAAEIIEDEEALPEDDQEKFLSIISSDARRLSEVAQALAGFFDSSHVRIGSATPMEHVDAYILEHHNYFKELEDVAADLLRQSPGEPAEAMLTPLSGRFCPCPIRPVTSFDPLSARATYRHPAVALKYHREVAGPR